MQTYTNAPAKWTFQKDTRVVTHRDAGEADARGRQIGLQITTEVLVVEASRSGNYAVPSQGTGTFIYTVCHVTRNGRPHGASQPAQLFRLPSEAEAYIERRYADVVKKANRDAQKRAGIA